MTTAISELLWRDFTKQVLTEQGYKFRDEVKGPLILPFAGVKSNLEILVIVGDDVVTSTSFIVMLGRLPLLIPTDKRGEALETLNKHSLGEAIGSYELHGDPAQVIFKVGREINPEFSAKDIESMLALTVNGIKNIEKDALTIVR